VARISSYGWLVAIMAGLYLESQGLVALAFALFAAVAAFHVATLPVELDASRRALTLLSSEGILAGDELPVAQRVLRAAALTYLVAALTAIAELLRIVLEFTFFGDGDGDGDGD
jgi:Zn-dependent membrane protease YugP